MERWWLDEQPMEGANRLDRLWATQAGIPAGAGIRCGRKDDHTMIDHENKNNVVQCNRKQNRDAHLQWRRCKKHKAKFTHSKQRKGGYTRRHLV
eukprot:12245546-Heterocapsa_arctica.AAC.1